MTFVAMVLGAGGVLGSAFHDGVVAALEEATGWDARRADLLVGTSAGANTAATLRAGLPPADHLARIVGRPLTEEGETVTARLRTPFSLGTHSAGRLRPPASARLVVEGLLAPGPVRPVVSLAGLLPRGTASTGAMAARIRECHPEPWPTAPTWICAVSVRTGRRVVFGREDVHVDHIGTAVAASSAVPGYFAPVRVGGVEHVDGGVHSTTNADLTAGLGMDLVVVSAPMTAEAGSRRLPTGRAWHSRVLRREVRAVAGPTTVLVVQPGQDVLHFFAGGNMDGGRSAQAAELGHRRTLEALDRARRATDVLQAAAGAARIVAHP
jgi:NTE family protein